MTRRSWFRHRDGRTGWPDRAQLTRALDSALAWPIRRPFL